MSRRLAVAVAKPSELAATEDPLDLATGALERLDALVADAGSGVQVATEVLKKLFADEADAEREAFAAAKAQGKAGPGDLVSVPSGTSVTPRCLAERLYGATVALPHPAREALDMRPGAPPWPPPSAG